MKETYFSNWNSILLSIVSWTFLFAVGYGKFGFSRGVQIGSLLAIGYVLWLIWERWTTYIAIEDSRWMINAEQRFFPNIKVDIASILYIARVPHFIFRSWGGRMVVYFRDEQGKVRATYIPESLYSWDSLQAILKKLVSIKASIEIDSQYQLLMSKKDPLDADLSQQLPRSLREIEAYVASKYGPA